MENTRNDFGLIDDNSTYKGFLLNYLLGFELKQLLLKSPDDFSVDNAGNVALLDGNTPIDVFTKIGE